MNTSPEMINEAYQKIDNSRTDFYAATSNLALAKKELKDAEATAIVNGVEGKNAEQRKANLRVACNAEIVELEESEIKFSAANHVFLLARSSIERLEMLMRYDELVRV